MRLAVLLLALAGCIPLAPDERLSALAREEWAHVGAPERFSRPPSAIGAPCLGFPGAFADADGVTTYVPWPWSECDAIARVVMRYELAKVAWQLHGRDADGSLRWYGPLLILDGLLHLPPSELRSWWFVVAR